ncbi:GNAT family N-acetyltransferase [Pseudidiomarina aestuarii]|uniref:GNAT family N-acetyltransferase n=1 Tax=Pseudidiomarina aestuarii TaxID=624146 RepID=A0A7Z7ETK1_9GAMM|nr:N-acetyltransferase [Pseudidiomarina aestuarii]RUO40899.1 GNAT family N-acetyltransferase [Pseudidiomarina aestuarii]
MTTIRLAEIADIAAISEIEKGFYGADGYPSAFFYQALSQWPQWFLCAEHDRRIQGYLLAAPSNNCSELWLMSLLVASSARGLGIGNQLVTSFQNHCREDRVVHQVHLSVAPDNISAQQLYFNHGFQITATKYDYLGPGQDRLLLTWTCI